MAERTGWGCAALLLATGLAVAALAAGWRTTGIIIGVLTAMAALEPWAVRQPPAAPPPPVPPPPPPASGGPSAEPYGEDLATRVLARLRSGARLHHDHRDYCGMGLAWRDGCVFYLRVSDGWLDPAELVTGREAGPLQPGERIFIREADFTAWLAEQSDHSLDGAGEGPGMQGNQRITRARLEAFADGQSAAG